MLMFAILISGIASAQELCWNAEHGVLEVQGVEYTTNENLFDEYQALGDRPPHVSRITATSTSTTVSGSVILEIHATDDNGIVSYSFIADRPHGGHYPNTGERISIGSGRQSETMYQFFFPQPGLWRTYIYVNDTAGQSALAPGPDILVTEN